MKIVFIQDPHFSSATPSSRIDNYLEAILAKFEYVLRLTASFDGILIMGGDIFQTPAQPDYVKNAIIKLIKKYKVKVYTIIGNHDLLYYNLDFVDKTSLGVMMESGVITELIYEKLENEWELYGHRPGEEFPVVRNNEKSIIVSHSFLGKKYGDKLVVNTDDVKKSKARFLCLGHDHNRYPIKDMNGTWVIRPGALSRGSSATENRVRIISCAILELSDGTAEYHPVPIANEFEDVFKVKFTEQSSEPVSFDDIREFIDKLNKADVSVNPYDILLKMDLPEEVYKKDVYYLEGVGLIKHELLSE